MSNTVLRARRIKDVVTYVLGIVFGIGLLIGGVVTLNGDGTVDCGGHEMKAGDTCTTTSRHGSSTTRTIDEQNSRNKRIGWTLIVVGPLLSAGCVWLLRGELRKPTGPTAAAGSPPPPNNSPYPMAQPPGVAGVQASPDGFAPGQNISAGHANSAAPPHTPVYPQAAPGGHAPQQQGAPVPGYPPQPGAPGPGYAPPQPGTSGPGYAPPQPGMPGPGSPSPGYRPQPYPGQPPHDYGPPPGYPHSGPPNGYPHH
ncbi:hypothetical protein [Nocardia wallacei]|uniref:hypothetical protein n=1 Tax=Nocardia wallacei TaxID=480035 RepID=UPI002458EC16|nr:hypothetical protein [Nocardia wallacei]